MAKRNREEDDVRRLEKELREIKAENRSLMKQLKKLNRGYHKIREDLDEDDQTDFEVEKYVLPTCHQCGKGELIQVEVVGRRWKRCTTCEYRSRAEKV